MQVKMERGAEEEEEEGVGAPLRVSQRKVSPATQE